MEKSIPDGDRSCEEDDDEKKSYPEERLLDSDELEQEAGNCDTLYLGMEIGEEAGTDGSNQSNQSFEKPSGSVEDEETIFFFVSLVVSLRDFKGQTSAGEFDTWFIYADSVEEFLHCIWEKSRKHHIVAICDDEGNITYNWHAKEAIDETDFVNFALLYNKQNRRATTVDKLTTNILQNWRTNSSVELLLHKYSLIVNSKAVWKKVEKALIDTIPKNRAGAASTEYAQELANELRLKHGYIWNGHEIAWSIEHDSNCTSSSTRVIKE